MIQQPVRVVLGHTAPVPAEPRASPGAPRSWRHRRPHRPVQRSPSSPLSETPHRPPGPGPTCEDEQADPGRGSGSGPSSSEMRGQGGSRPSLLSLTPCGPGIVIGYAARCCRRRLSGRQPHLHPHRHLPGHSLLRAGECVTRAGLGNGAGTRSHGPGVRHGCSARSPACGRPEAPGQQGERKDAGARASGLHPILTSAGDSATTSPRLCLLFTPRRVITAPLHRGGTELGRNPRSRRDCRVPGSPAPRPEPQHPREPAGSASGRR